jgi:hypothetical protein
MPNAAKGKPCFDSRCYTTVAHSRGASSPTSLGINTFDSRFVQLRPRTGLCPIGMLRSGLRADLNRGIVSLD